MQTKSLQEGDTKEEPIDSQPLSKVIWDDQVPKNFKPPMLVSFDGKTNPLEHIIVINNQMTIAGTSDSLKCKLMVVTFKEGALRWHMSLPRFSIISYKDLTKKTI